MGKMKMTACMKVISALRSEDQDALMERLETYVADGMPPERAQIAATADAIADIKGERRQFMTLLREQQPDLFVDVPADVPDSAATTSPLRRYDLNLEREERGTIKTAKLSTDEVAAVTAAGRKIGMNDAQIAAVVLKAKDTKRQFPVSRGWAPLTVTAIAVKTDASGEPRLDTAAPKFLEIPYAFNVPPGAKRASAKPDLNWQKKVADEFARLVEDIYARAEDGDQNAQTIISHQTWYRSVAEVLRREYGGFGDTLADLLGATSPNTPVDTNWNFSIDVLRNFARGNYDDQLRKFSDYMASGGTPGNYPAAEKIRQLSGKLYGMNSTNAMLALNQVWRSIEPGQAPKARNFALNLIGQSNMATIDVWAARMLRRAANMVPGASFPRIPTVAEDAVSGNWSADKSRVLGAFGFGADVMAEVSDRLRKQGYDVAPPDLQAIAWFAEKELWGRKGWTTKVGEGGSFEKKIEDEPGERYLAGVSIQQGELSPSDADMKLTSNRLASVIVADNAVMAVRVQPTFGLYAGVRERAFDAEWVVQRGQYDPSAAVAELAAVAQENDQWDIFVSRVMAPDEDNPNARPGVEVYLKNPTSLATVMPMLDAFTARGQDGFTLVVDPRAKFGVDEFIGVRLQYVPEISMRWDEGERARLLAPGGIEAELVKKASVLGDIVAEISAVEGVAFAARQKYDTVVIGKENYDGYIDRGNAGGNRAPGGEVWFGQPLREGLERAVARYEGKRGQVDPGRVPGTDAQLQPGLQKSARVVSPLGFYSELASQVGSASMNQAPPVAWKAFIKALTQKGVKADEIEWAGVNDWLDLQEGRVGKAALLDYINSNGVQVTEVALGRDGESDPDDWEPDDGRVGNTRYGNYVVPGGQNYRELLLTLPPSKATQTAMMEWRVVRDDGVADGNYATEAGAMARALMIGGSVDAGRSITLNTGYRSSHWSQLNVLAHLRVDDRTDADGKKVLFIHELQSDWGQDARKKGVSTPESTQALRELERDVKVVEAKKTDARLRMGVMEGSLSRPAYLQGDQATKDRMDANYRDARDDYLALVPKAMAANTALDAAKLKAKDAVPAGPFINKTDAWVGLALKRAMAVAVAGDYDRVAMVTGDQAVDIFDLSKQVEYIQWGPNYDNGRLINLEQKGGGDGVSISANNDGLIYDSSIPGAEGKSLPDVLGKDLSAKIMGDASGSLRGLELKVGGDGMRSFYNKIVPQVARDVLKKIGGPGLSQVYLRDANAEPEMIGVDEDGEAVYNDGIQVGAAPQPGFDITDEMRDKVATGLPLFSARADKAEAAGFDTSKVWYHGTTARDFTAFKAGKNGFDELGTGIYFTSDPGVAEAWAGRGAGGRIIPAFLKRGDVFDKSKPVDFLALAERIQRENPVSDNERRAAEIRATKSVTQWTPEESRIVNDASSELWRTWLTVPAEELAANMKTMRGNINAWLDRAGYVGAINPNSQIRGQVVVFDAANIRSPWARFNPRYAGSDRLLASARVEDGEPLPVNPRLESWVNNVRAGRAADPGFVLSESPHPAAQMAGLGRSTPVVITADFVRHLKNKGRDEADVPAGVLAQLQGLLANPRAMIRQSNKGEDSFQFFVDSRNDAGEPLFVVLKRSKLAAGRQEMRVTDVRTAYNHSNSMWYLMKAMEAGEFVWMTEKEIARVRDFTDEGLIPYGTVSSAVPPQTTSSVAPRPRKAQVSQATNRTVYGGEALVKFGRGDASWKSATQTVSVSPDDLRRASAERLAFSARPGAGTWDGPGASRFDDFVYKAQDKLIDTKRVIESITKAGRQIADDLNVYLQEELFHGRAAKRTEDFGTQELGPLMEQLKADGLTIGDIEEYLHARHAKEANALIAGREPGMPDGGSGMTDQAADDYFNKLSPADAAKLDAAAQRVDTILATTRQLYADYGLESQDTVDAWAQMFQNYVPLMREEKEGSGMGIGQGFSVKGKEVKGRTGSTRKVVDILANIAMQRERVIVRGEKNRVAVALVGLARANPSGDFWSVGPPPAERVYDPKTDTVVDRVDPMFKTRDNVLVAKVKDANGDVTEQAVVFNEDDPRALRMAMSLKNLDAGALEGLLGASAKVTRYFSAVNTQYNPVFGIVNLIRDVQGALINLGATPLAGKQLKIAGYTASALRGIYGNLRSGGTNQWSALWQQFQEDGGQTGYRDLFRTSQDRAEALQKTLTPDGWADSKLGKIFTAGGALKVPLVQAKRGAGWIFDWLSDYNEAMENSVRLASYKAALDQGMSREKAASLAKNLTVNFNRKGQVGQQAGALYAFFNAAMQGSAKLGQVLFEMDGGNPKTLRLSPTGKKVVYGGMLLGATQALALAAAGFDDEDPPEFLRERSLIIPLGGKKYFSIPMPLGLHVIPGLGRHATEFALSGFAKPAKRAVDVFGMFADAFNPIGNAGLSIQTIAPTIIDPLVALKENKDFAGRPIARTTSNPATPGFTQWKDSATAPAKWIAEGINYLSGGNKYVAGVLSPTPDQIDYLFAQVTGGVGRELSKVENTAKGVYQGEEVATYKIPLFGRFFGDARSQANEGNAFYANTRKLNELETEIKAMRKDGKTAEANALQASRPDAYLITQANVAERQVQRLRREKREMIEGGAERGTIRAKEEQITAAMARLNRAAERQREMAEK